MRGNPAPGTPEGNVGDAAFRDIAVLIEEDDLAPFAPILDARASASSVVMRSPSSLVARELCARRGFRIDGDAVQSGWMGHIVRWVELC